MGKLTDGQLVKEAGDRPDHWPQLIEQARMEAREGVERHRARLKDREPVVPPQ